MESPEGKELASLCLDFGYKLAESPSDLTRDQINFLFTALNQRTERIAAARSGETGFTKFMFFDDESDEET